jgi:XTP/dITP diphosphohydrolase
VNAPGRRARPASERPALPASEPLGRPAPAQPARRPARPAPARVPSHPSGLPRLVVATRSRHKLAELRDLLRLERTELLALDDLGVIEEPVEDGASFAANASLKARFYARATGLPTLADDSGLEVDALGGGPGVRTRRFAGEDASDADNNARLLAELEGLPPERRGARYRCVLALALPGEAGPRGGLPVRLARGTFPGRIADGPRGTNGFGYDPIFEPAGEPPGGATVGEWPPERKAAASHRARAARRMARILRAIGT